LPCTRQLGEQAVEVARQVGDERLLIDAVAMQCAICYTTGELEKGLSLGQEAVERARHPATMSCWPGA
jgi:hypothetical protein